MSHSLRQREREKKERGEKKMLQETPLKDPEWACYEGHVGKRYGVVGEMG